MKYKYIILIKCKYFIIKFNIKIQQFIKYIDNYLLKTH